MNLPEIELSEDGRSYVCDGKSYVRVTDVIHKVMPPYLAPWAEKVGHQAMFTVLNDMDAPLTLEDARREIREAGLTCEDEKARGGDRGSALHQVIEAMILTGDPLALSDFDDPEHAKYAQTFAQWMLDYKPEFHEAEIRIVHPDLGYAGTFDALATLHARPKGARGPDLTGKTIILDWKTNVSKSVYDSHLYQLAAYQLAAQHWGIKHEGAAVVAIGPMGDIKGKPYSLKPNYVEPKAFAQIMATYDTLIEQKKRNPLGRSK